VFAAHSCWSPPFINVGSADGVLLELPAVLTTGAGGEGGRHREEKLQYVLVHSEA
jgi:hypothetical protein